MIPLLLDMGLPRRLVGLLEHDGWDAQHVAALGHATSPDADLVHIARAAGRTIVTMDSDFAAILAGEQAASPSVIHIRLQGLNAYETRELLRDLVPRIHDDLRHGCIASVTANGVRIRPLPIVTSKGR